MTSNAEVAAELGKVADLVEERGANVFRVRSIRNVARMVNNFPENLETMIAAGVDLSSYTGISKNMAHHLARYLETGRLGLLEEEEHKHARHKAKGPTPTMLARAEEIAEALLAFLKADTRITEAFIGGAYRRRKDTIAVIDIVAVSASAAETIERFAAYPDVVKTLRKEESSLLIELISGMKAELRLYSPDVFGTALFFSTGSAAHCGKIQELAHAEGIEIHEAGMYRGNLPLSVRTDADIYRAIHLPYIEPELREDRGEIDAAKNGNLPCLVTLGNIRGDLHMHTKDSDGHMTIAEMADAAQKLGHEYIGITDHTESLIVARGMDVKQRRRQLETIDALNAQLSSIRILKSAEVDILEDGRLDMDEELLKQLDYTVCSIHTRFHLPKDRQTERIIRAMDNPYFQILGHPTGRLINERSGYDVDIPKIIRAAKERGRFLEINCQPDRLDLDDIHARMAKDEGVMISIATDSHSALWLSSLRLGVNQARRGWLEAKDVLNTKPLPELLMLFGRS